jgi:hypothetical protein
MRVWWQNRKSLKTGKAYRNLCKAIRDDPGYRQTILSNITMPIYDATRPVCWCDAIRRGPGDGGHLGSCAVYQANSVPLRFELREMSIEQATYIAEKIMNHLFKTDYVR